MCESERERRGGDGVGGGSGRIDRPSNNCRLEGVCLFVYLSVCLSFNYLLICLFLSFFVLLSCLLAYLT